MLLFALTVAVRAGLRVAFLIHDDHVNLLGLQRFG